MDSADLTVESARRRLEKADLSSEDKEQLSYFLDRFSDLEFRPLPDEEVVRMEKALGRPLPRALVEALRVVCEFGWRDNIIRARFSSYDFDSSPWGWEGSIEDTWISLGFELPCGQHDTFRVGGRQGVVVGCNGSTLSPILYVDPQDPDAIIRSFNYERMDDDGNLEEGWSYPAFHSFPSLLSQIAELQAYDGERELLIPPTSG